MSVQQITSIADFEEKVVSHQGITLIDFWAPWCGPCKMVAPEVEAVAAEYEGRVQVVKVNVDEVAKLASDHNIMGIPTLMFFKKGEAVERVTGYRPKADIAKIIDGLL